jgi:HK97 gp10 family phage protein
MAKRRTRGFDVLSRKLAKLPPAMTETLRRELNAAALRILAEAQARVPVDTGKLIEALTIKLTRNGLKVSVGVQGAPAKNRVPYYFYVEFGTNPYGKHPVKAQPYLRPAAKLVRAEFRARIQEALRSTAQQVAGK